MRPSRLALLLIGLAITLPPPLTAQLLYEGNQSLPPWGGFAGSGFDTVSLQNGNLLLRIPVASYKQRGGGTPQAES